MKINAKKMLLAVIVGAVVMVLTDLVSGRLTNSFFALPFSVFAGSIVAGYLVVNFAWLSGVVLGLINSLITLVIYLKFGAAEVNLAQAMLYPVIYYLIAGLLGGVVGGLLGMRFGVFNRNASA